MGFSRNEPWLYLSGDNPELLDVYPELGYLRDIVYLLKAFMAPTSDALPEVCLVGLVFVHLLLRPMRFVFGGRGAVLVVLRVDYCCRFL